MTVPEQIRRQSEAIAKHYGSTETQSDTLEATASEVEGGSQAVSSEHTDSVENTAPESDRKSTRLNSSHSQQSRMPSSA